MPSVAFFATCLTRLLFAVRSTPEGVTSDLDVRRCHDDHADLLAPDRRAVAVEIHRVALRLDHGELGADPSLGETVRAATTV
ncbi:MAG: hypothetical protein R2705_22550 [Ilumatobacteraceae bacterium]